MPNPLYDRQITISRPAIAADGYGGPPRLAELPLIQTLSGAPQSSQQSGGTWQFSATGGKGTAIPAALQLSRRVRGRNPTGLPEDTTITWFECFLDLLSPITDGANRVTTILEDDKITDEMGRRFVVVGVYPQDALGTLNLILERTKV